MELIDYSFGSNPFIFTLFSWLTWIIIRLYKYKLNYVGTFRKSRKIQFHTLEISIDKDVVVSFRGKESCDLVTKLGVAIPVYVPCDIVQNPTQLNIYWKDHAKLVIRHGMNGKYHIYEFDWLAADQSKLEDQIMMAEGGHWYGAGHVFNQPWPMEKWYYKLGAFITKEGFPFKSNYGELLERMWMSSSGIAMIVDFDVPLFVSTNFDYDRKIRLVSSYKSPYQNHGKRAADGGKNVTFLKYSIIQTCGDICDAFQSLRQTKMVPLPENIPDEAMFKHPIWSTWAQYKKSISQEKVIQFAKDIKKHGFRAAQLEIDDDWTPHYGDWEFDLKKFRDPKKMVNILKDLGFRVMLWVHPFASPQSAAFQEGWKVDNNVWVKWKWTGLPALVSWWNGYGALLDVTSPPGVDWFKKKLQRVANQYGISSFKVDAGEAARLSTWMVTNDPMETPNTYTKLFAELTYDLDRTTRAQELRVGTGVQHLPLFFRLQDKDSNWSRFNGIKTVIPHVLTQGLLGYPFVLPDMIGGNAYSILPGSSYPEKELFIRWVQLNALLPSMQFSVVPWMYDDETIKICRSMCELHEQYSSKLVSLAREATRTGTPIIRPLWWLAPKDEVALTISTQFLLGEDVIVAPVLERGARVRDVYLPCGTWTDATSNNQLEGGRWHRDYQAELHQLPIFTKL